jgi:hypothetical protein
LASSSTTEAEGDRTGARPRQVLLVAWRGDAFVGWQRQPAGRSVQVVLEDALRTLHGGADTHALAAGRTDAGVHAWAQVVRIDAATLRRPEATLRGLHALLPPDLSCLAVGAAPPGFHPVRDAVEKHYRYRILARGTRCPFREGAVWRLHHDLDRGAMAEAGAAVDGSTCPLSWRSASAPTKAPSSSSCSAKGMRSSASLMTCRDGVESGAFSASAGHSWREVRPLASTAQRGGLRKRASSASPA